ncbi:N-acetylmuramoyl-L-alanine amidase [Paenibacillus shirakamiensis]|uniref:N-acetylmuramoyl-L-alanine amidase n=1 Tax=Paenibacillus shirakamiensis TaxID=1265935 RepID=A0ABS4JD58_9BACL|nr:N-acetylmuramoyl-L-alanine amidase family protein [Paenibacillus shirakamiensis]MBP1999605.1 N-acetylmuramoyl-L-alanine amidase [Paenibacillus shirakamiensis]
MKKLVFGLLLVLFLWAIPGHMEAAGSGTHINLDGQEVKLTQDTQVQTVQDTIMVPLRVIVEQLGYDVNWDSKTSSVTIEQAGNTLKLTVNKKSATVNGQKVTLRTAPLLKGNTTYVPLRFVSEQTGVKVVWDESSKTAFLTSVTQTGESGGKGTTTNSGNTSGGDTEGNVVIPPVAGGNGSGTSTGTGTSVSSKLASIGGISFSDNRLVIAVDGKTTPKTSILTNPNRIVVDIPNTKFSDLFLASQALDIAGQGILPVIGYPDLSQVRFSLFNSSPSTVRIVLDLNYSKNFELTNAGDGLIVVDLNKDSSTTPVVPPGGNGKKLVVLDAGHGGKDSGAISITGRYEKNFNLAVILKVADLLKKQSDIDFVLTRSDDSFPSLQDRAKIANDLHADVFISVHGNSGSPAATGSETYYTRSDSAPLANIMHKYLTKATGLPDRRVNSKSLHVTRETKMPAVLLEVGYLSNKRDEGLMYDDAFQQRVAEGIVAGIKEYLGIR